MELVDMVITRIQLSKVNPKFYGEGETASLILRFLEELGLDYLDLVLLHLRGLQLTFGRNL